MDRISILPDGLIADILSRLALEDALVTSFLSKRWRYLWIAHATCLDFYNCWDISAAQFVELVDGLLQQYNKSGDRDRSLQRFSIRCEIRAEHKSCIGRWVKFALSKQVKELALHFWSCSDGGIDPREHLLSSDIIADADVIGETLLRKSLPGYRSCGSSWTIGLRYLKHIVLRRVSIEGKFIDYLLANCSVLERLVLVSCSIWKSKLVISGQSLKLKVLHIEHCRPDSTHIEIYNVNLVSLTYRGIERIVPRLFGNIPQLAELCIGWNQPLRQDTILEGLFSDSISHVQILKLEFAYVKGMDMPKLPQLRSVMQLEITLGSIGDDSLLLFAHFTEACPNLRKFILTIMRTETSMIKTEQKRRSFVGLPLEHLELVEFHGLYGRSSHYELVQYFIKYAVALKKLVVKLVVDSRRWYAVQTPEVVNESRESVKQQLEGKLPPRIDLVII